MAQCKKCKKSGFFFSVPKYGICLDCLNLIRINSQLILSVNQELIELAEKANDIETIINRMDLAIQHTSDLMDYDIYGVYDLSTQLEELKSKKEHLIYNQLKLRYKDIEKRLTTEISEENRKTLLIKYESDLQKYYHLINSYQTDLNSIYQSIEFELAGTNKKKRA